VQAHAQRTFYRHGRQGYHTVECSTFDPKIHNPKREFVGWYRSHLHFPRKATDEQVAECLANFVSTLREYLDDQSNLAPE